MSTIEIVILIFYILGYILCFWILTSDVREHNDYLTVFECFWMSLLSLLSWIGVCSIYFAIHGDEPFIKFKK